MAPKTRSGCVDRGVNAGYMAPELWDAKDVVDARPTSALGVIFYECCAAPHRSSAARETCRSHWRSRRPVRLSSKLAIAPALDDAVLRCLAKDPAKRFDSVASSERPPSARARGGRAPSAAPVK
jgi:serine/threonine protein kinase